MVMTDMRPLNIVYGAGFKEYSKTMDSRCVHRFAVMHLAPLLASFSYVLPTKGELKTMVHELSERNRRSVMSEVKKAGKVSITCDCWSRFVTAHTCK
jgi:hypothetical protein